MPRPSFINFLSVILAVLTAVGVTSCAREQAKQPNILFLFADDQRADTIGAWGNPYIHTPNIDRLVADGFSFRNNYNFGGDTGAVCIPSRAMLNSGRTYFRVRHDLAGVKIMPEVLQENGYVTFATGKWHNKRPSWLRGFGRGKAVFFGGMSNHTKVPVVDLSADGKLVNQRIGKEFSSVLFADAAVDFLHNYKGDKPFYAYVAFTSPHDPRQPPVAYREMYYNHRPPLPKNFLPQHPFNIGPMMLCRDEQLAPWPRPKWMISDQICEYYGMVTYLDQQIGRVLQALKDSGRADNTIIIYAADQGLALGSHGLLGKQSIYEDSQKCPLIFVGPGIPKGKSTKAFSYLLDVFPTVASLAGITVPDGVDGHDLSPIWRGEKPGVRDSLFLAFMDQMRSVRDRSYKLIRYPQINYTQLFDLQTDPDEMHNLAAAPAQAERIKKMMALIERWEKKVGDKQPLTVKNPKPMKIDLTGHPRKPDKFQPAWIVKKYF